MSVQDLLNQLMGDLNKKIPSNFCGNCCTVMCYSRGNLAVASHFQIATFPKEMRDGIISQTLDVARAKLEFYNEHESDTG